MKEKFMPTPEEIKKAEDMMTPEQKKMSEERENDLESQEEIKDIEGQVGNMFFEAKVKIDSNGDVVFLEDIDKETGTIMDESDIEELFEAGLLEKGNPDSNKSHYALAEGDANGYVLLNKDDLNNAIKSGKLKAEIDEEGELMLYA